jgi:GT2 family glycosyltransferase
VEAALKTIDIILVNYNSTDLLLRSLGSIYESLGDFSAQVIVCDNGSRDGVERVASLFPHVLLIEKRANCGFAKAVNFGLRRGNAPYVVLLNPDTDVANDFFNAALTFMAENEDVGILGPRILDTGRTVQDSARAFPNFLTGLFGRSSLLTRWFPNNCLTRRNLVAKASDGITPMEVAWVSGACMVARRKAIDEVGPLDERFFLYWEDADWCRRMWEAEWKVVYFPEACVVHHVGGSSKTVPARALVEFHRSAYRLLAKYARGPERLLKPLALWVLALRLLAVLAGHGMRELIRMNQPSETR